MSIGTAFDKNTHDPSSFSLCATGDSHYATYVVILLHCSSPIIGRYVSISLSGTKKLYLSHVRVLTSLCKSFIPIKVMLIVTNRESYIYN